MYENAYGEELFSLITPDRDSAKSKQLEKQAEIAPENIFVCEEDSKIVGFVTFMIYPEKKTGEIGNNAVDPECGIKGVGQRMYRAVFDHFKKEGLLFAKVSTGLDDAHSRARRAYERAGFNIKTESVCYYRKL
jgi:ribosomal protein S18 acetylase RimI-like enzyme